MELTDIVKKYVEQPDTDFAILINGQWGSGKTYFLKNEIAKTVSMIEYRLSDEKNSAFELIYLSLYGISSADELQKRLFLEINPILKTKVGKVASIVMTKGLQLFGMDSNDKDQEDLMNILGGIPQNKILVFDDLERLEVNILNEVFGFINSYTEHQNLKVIIIADEKKIEEKLGNKDYKGIKEKLIRFTYLYNPNLIEVFPSFVHRYVTKEYQTFLTERTQIICNLFNKGEHKNLRSLRFVLDLFEQIFISLFEDTEIEVNHRNTILDRFLFFFITYSIAFKKGAGENNLCSLKQLSSEIDIPINRVFFHLLNQNNEKEQEQTLEGTEKFKKGFENAFVDDTKNEFQYFAFLANYIHTGDLSLSELKSVAIEIQQKLKDKEQKPEQIALDKLNNCLELNNEEFTPLIQKIYSYVEDGVYKLEVYPVLFQNILNCSLNGIENLKLDEDTVNLFKAGMDKSLAISKYKYGFNSTMYIQEPEDKMLEEVRKYSKKLNDSLLVKNDAVVANKVFTLFIKENFEDLKELLLSEDVQSSPIFQEEYINPSEFFKKFLELTNANKIKIIDLLRSFSVRFTNYGSDLIKELPFFSKLHDLVEEELNRSKGSFHISTENTVRLKNYLFQILEKFKKMGKDVSNISRVEIQGE